MNKASETTDTDLMVAYAKVIGRGHGKGPAQKLHYTRDGRYTLCGLSCYPGSRHPAWTEVCGRCRAVCGK
jgi:hypothetical protein